MLLNYLARLGWRWAPLSQSRQQQMRPDVEALPRLDEVMNVDEVSIPI
jgi:hypothetical protein